MLYHLRAAFMCCDSNAGVDTLNPTMWPPYLVDTLGPPYTLQCGHHTPYHAGVSTRGEHDYTLGAAPEEVPCGDKVDVWQFVTADAPDDNCGRRAVVPMAALRGCTAGEEILPEPASRNM